MSKQPVKLVLLLGAALIGLSACASGLEDKPIPTPDSPLATETWRDRIKVDGHADEIQLALHASGLSQNQDQALRALVSRWLDAQAREIGALVPFADGEGLTVSSPFHLDDATKIAPVRAPAVGQHSQQVLREAGYSVEEIARLEGLGVLGQHQGAPT